MFVRSIAMEGGIGPVAGSSHHSLYYRMPGIIIRSPMSPTEYEKCYEDFMTSQDVYYVSEHRGSYGNAEDLQDIVVSDPDICIFPISITRFEAIKAAEDLTKRGYRVSVFHIESIKPLKLSNEALKNLKSSLIGLVTDDDYCDGIAKAIAFDLTSQTRAFMGVLGLKDRTAGFDAKVDNLPPNKNEIMNKVQEMLERKK